MRQIQMYKGIILNRLMNDFSCELSTFIYNPDEDEISAIILGKRLDMTVEDQGFFHLLDEKIRIWPGT